MRTMLTLAAALAVTVPIASHAQGWRDDGYRPERPFYSPFERPDPPPPPRAYYPPPRYAFVPPPVVYEPPPQVVYTAPRVIYRTPTIIETAPRYIYRNRVVHRVTPVRAVHAAVCTAPTAAPVSLPSLRPAPSNNVYPPEHPG